LHRAEGDKEQKVLQKIEHVCGSVSLDDLCLRWAPVRNPVFRNPEFPLIAIIGIVGRERRDKPAHQKVTKQSLSNYA
jgi:hypothetical protein